MKCSLAGRLIGFLFFLVIFFSLFYFPVLADEPPNIVDVEGRIYELDGFTPISTSVNISLKNQNNSVEISGTTSRADPSFFKISINGDPGDIALLRVWTRENQNNKTIFLGVIRNETINLNMNLANNYAPDFYSTPITTAYEDSPYSYAIEAEDINNDEFTLTLINYPLGMILANATLFWTPNQQNVNHGNYELSIKASDGILDNYQNFSITPVNVNGAPSIISYPELSAKELESYSYQVSVYDEDNDNITYSLITGPTGISLNQNTGLILWTPSVGQRGKHLVEISASDSKETTLQQFVIWVTNTSNSKPVISSTPTLAAYVNSTYSYAIQAADTDNDELNYELLEGPDTASLSGNTVFWEPTDSDFNNSFRFVIRVLDNKLGIDTQVFYVNVSSLFPQSTQNNGETPTTSIIRRSSINFAFIPVNFTFKKPSNMTGSNVSYYFNEITLFQISINFKSFNSGEIPILNVRDLSEKPLEISSAPFITYSYIEIVLNSTQVVDEATIHFAVPNNFIARTNATAENIALLRYFNNSWIDLPTVIVNSDENKSYFKSVSSGFSYFAIVLFNITRMPETKIYVEPPKLNSSNYFKITGIIYVLDKSQIDAGTKYEIVNKNTGKSYLGYTGIISNSQNDPGKFEKFITAKKDDELTITIYSEEFSKKYQQSITIANDKSVSLEIFTDIPKNNLLNKIKYPKIIYYFITAIFFLVVSFILIIKLRIKQKEKSF